MNSSINDVVSFIYQEADKNNKSHYSSVTVRIDSRTGLMLKEISNTFNFPVSTTFSDVISAEICNMLLNISSEELDMILKEFGDMEKINEKTGFENEYIGAIKLLNDHFKGGNKYLAEIIDNRSISSVEF